jgi:hypothetical protein
MVAFAAAVWVVAVAQPLVSFVLISALALAWCAWLERHPEPRPCVGQRTTASDVPVVIQEQGSAPS